MQSDGGSPTAGAIDGAQLALRMIEAAESAAAAAKAAATRPESRDDWYKMLPKPSCFEPKDRDAELSQFRDWWWSVEQYLTAVDVEYSILLISMFCARISTLKLMLEHSPLNNVVVELSYMGCWLVFLRTGRFFY